MKPFHFLKIIKIALPSLYLLELELEHAPQLDGYTSSKKGWALGYTEFDFF
jgi:hypothetical protein